MAAISRMYAADRLWLTDLDGDLGRVLKARSCAELDEIAGELLPAHPAGALRAQAARDSPC